MSKKDQCKEIMSRLFGPATANMIDKFSEEECVQKCREKVIGFLGPEKAKLFDNIV
jgi:hypothetical protein